MEAGTLTGATGRAGVDVEVWWRAWPEWRGCVDSGVERMRTEPRSLSDDVCSGEARRRGEAEAEDAAELAATVACMPARGRARAAANES